MGNLQVIKLRSLLTATEQSIRTIEVDEEGRQHLLDALTHVRNELALDIATKVIPGQDRVADDAELSQGTADALLLLSLTYVMIGDTELARQMMDTYKEVSGLQLEDALQAIGLPPGIPLDQI